MPALEKKRSIGPLAPSARAISARMSCSRPTSAVIGEAADLLRHLARVRLVHVGDDDGARALVGEAQRERAADAAAGAGDDDVPALELHAAGSLLFGRVKSREVRLARRPVGEPKPEDFELAERELGEPGRGQAARPQPCS